MSDSSIESAMANQQLKQDKSNLAKDQITKHAEKFMWDIYQLYHGVTDSSFNELKADVQLHNGDKLVLEIRVEKEKKSLIITDI